MKCARLQCIMIPAGDDPLVLPPTATIQKAEYEPGEGFYVLIAELVEVEDVLIANA